MITPTLPPAHLPLQCKNGLNQTQCSKLQNCQLKNDSFEPSFTSRKKSIVLGWTGFLLALTSAFAFMDMNKGVNKLNIADQDKFQQHVVDEMTEILKPKIDLTIKESSSLIHKILEKTDFAPDNPMLVPLQAFLKNNHEAVEKLYADFTNASSKKGYIEITDDFLKSFNVDSETRTYFIEHDVKPNLDKIENNKAYRNSVANGASILLIIGMAAGCIIMYRESDKIYNELQQSEKMDKKSQTKK
ncbi:MAG: hypothetical protein AB7V50_05795 [Vampirovibrionia bacterium]